MSDAGRVVKTELQLRVTVDGAIGTLTAMLRTLRESGGFLKAHLVYRSPETDGMAALLLCDEPKQAAAALREEGFDLEMETVVTVRTENGRGALSHLVRCLEVEGIQLGYTYAAPNSDGLLVVFQTDDDPKAEGVLSSYLELHYDSD